MQAVNETGNLIPAQTEKMADQVVIEVGRARALVGGCYINLSADEMALLTRLYRARGYLVPVNHLEATLYEQPGWEREIPEIKYHIRNLRRKLKDENKTLLFCRRRLGYGLEVERVCWLE